MTNENVTLQDMEYIIPKSHIEAVIRAGEGREYIRLAPPNEKYILIYDESYKYSRNWQGEDVPLVTDVNDIPAKSFERFNFDGGATVCRSDIPLRSCGMRIVDAGVPWSVLFNREQLSQSDEIRSSALKVVRSYRRSSDANRS